VDLVPLLMTLASGGSNAWRNLPQYAYLAGRADLFDMLKDPNAKGRPYILHTSDEDIPEEATKLGIPYRDALVSQYLPPPPLPQQPPPTHIIGYRTKDAKLGVYSYFTPNTIEIETQGQQAELYDYSNFGIDEVTNNAPGGSQPEAGLYESLYIALFNNAIPNELRQPLPHPLDEVHQQAINDYLAYESTV
jgi:hypothetical protein